MTVSTNFSVFVHALVRCLTLLAVLVENCQLCIVSVIPQFFFVQLLALRVTLLTWLQPRMRFRCPTDSTESVTATKREIANTKSRRSWLRIMADVQRHARMNYQTMIRMRRYRAKLKGWDFDEVALVAIVPPEVLKEREEKKRKREAAKAAKLARASEPKRSRKRKPKVTFDVTDKEGGTAKRGRLEGDADIELPDLSTVGVVMPDVALIDKAVHDEKLDELTREDLLAKLHEKEQEIDQLVSTIADSN